MSKLTHIDDSGRATMVDVSEKSDTIRIAIATGQIIMSSDTLEIALSNNNAKGSVIRTAELAGIMAAKKTSDLIPLCHPLMLSKVSIDITPDHELPGLMVKSEVKLTGKTGVEMEALTAVSVACLTIYDMLKAAQKDMVIGPIKLVSKSGGKSGDFNAK